jgi:hypothetical protein
MIKKVETLVTLEPIEHVYIHRITGVKYSSVTKAISSIEPHFDEDAVAEAIVRQKNDVKNPKYINLNKNQILDMWHQMNDEANVYGSKVHDILEQYLLSDGWCFPKDDFEKLIISEFDKINIDKGMYMQPERIVFSEQHELAGMSDLIVQINDDFFDVWDWKSNKEYNFYNKFGNKTLNPPFDHLQCCQHSIYSLQLSIYAYMYELENPNTKCRCITVGYWDRKTMTFSRIPVTYLKKEAKLLIERHKYNINN